MAIGSFARSTEGHALNRSEAIALWLPFAEQVLTRVAATPYAVITYKDLADQVQSASGVHTEQLIPHWMGTLLDALIVAGHEAGRPPLTALVVHKEDGTVGEGYDAVIRAEGLAPPQDPLTRENHAAQGRVACYRWAGAPEPAEGWVPRLATEVRQRRATVRTRAAAVARPRAAVAQAVVAICPRCFVEMPVSGRCDSCD